MDILAVVGAGGLDWLGPLMFVGALLFLMLGYTVAFSLGGVAIADGIIGILLGEIGAVFITALP